MLCICNNYADKIDSYNVSFLAFKKNVRRLLGS